MEGAGPIGGIRRSGSLMGATFGGGLNSLRKAWSYGLGWLILLALLSIGGVALGVLGFSQLDANTAVGGLLVVIGVVLIAVAVVLNAAVGAIVQAALYFYAVEQKEPAGFPPGAVQGAFAPAT
jgi:O-antigen ligase